MGNAHSKQGRGASMSRSCCRGTRIVWHGSKMKYTPFGRGFYHCRLSTVRRLFARLVGTPDERRLPSPDRPSVRSPFLTLPQVPPPWLSSKKPQADKVL